jgi:hypothetical protein
MMEKNNLEQEIRELLNKEVDNKEPSAQWWNNAIKKATSKGNNSGIKYFFYRNRAFAPALAILAVLVITGVVLSPVFFGMGSTPPTTTKASLTTTTKQTTTETTTSSISLPWVFEGVGGAGIISEPYDIEFILNTELPLAVKTLAVYIENEILVDDDYALNIARQCGFTEDDAVPLIGDTRSVYSYKNSNANLEIKLDGSISLRTDTDSSKPENLPSDEECITIAVGWLESCGLTPENITDIETKSYMDIEEIDSTTNSVINKYSVATTVKFKVALNGYGLYSSAATVVIGENGKIIRADINLPNFEIYTYVDIITAGEALNILESYLEGKLDTGSNTLICLVNQIGFKKLIINDISIQYTKGNTDYLQPVYVFEGTAYFEYENGVTDTEDFISRVDAVIRD